MKTFKATIKTADGNRVEAQTQAKDYFSAKKLFEAQYGAGSVVSGPQEVR